MNEISFVNIFLLGTFTGKAALPPLKSYFDADTLFRRLQDYGIRLEPAVNERESPSESPSTRNEPPQQSPSVTSLPETRKRKHGTTTTDTRRIFGSFSSELVDDCNYIDAIANKLRAIGEVEAELDTPEAKRILRMNEEIIDYHQEYDDMMAQMAQSLNQREEWQKCILARALDTTREIYGAPETNTDNRT